MLFFLFQSLTSAIKKDPKKRIYFKQVTFTLMCIFKLFVKNLLLKLKYLQCKHCQVPSPTCNILQWMTPCLESRGWTTAPLGLQRTGKDQHSQECANVFAFIPAQRLTSCCFHSANHPQHVGPYAIFRLFRVLP